MKYTDEEKQKMLEREQGKIKMLNDVESGKRVVCPVCGKGIIYQKGPWFLCDNDECDFEIHVYYGHR